MGVELGGVVGRDCVFLVEYCYVVVVVCCVVVGGVVGGGGMV